MLPYPLDESVIEIQTGVKGKIHRCHSKVEMSPS
jgi:hypothetical protein